MRNRSDLKAALNALVGACAVLLVLGASGSPQGRHAERATEAAIVNQLWQWQRHPVATAAHTNAPVDLARFQEAVRFFEKWTGIPYGEGSSIGAIPSPRLKVALDRWDAWYDSNRQRLRVNWDECLLVGPSSAHASSDGRR